MPKVRGFTLVEIIITVGIFLILTTIVVAAFRNFETKASLDGDTKAIVNVLRLAQNKSLAAEGGKNYGVHFDSNAYTLFSDINYSPASPNNIIYNLSAKTEIYDILINGGGNEVIFNRVTGTAQQVGGLKIRLKNSPNQLNTIAVENSGRVVIDSALAPSGPIVIDSRHVHFDYNKGIKLANTLSLYFPDDNYTYNIDWQNYLNSPKDKFNWAGSVSVGGQPQSLEIVTHFLGDTSAIFSIHRDGRYNDKAVNVSLDGDSLINYVANGGVIRGTSPFVSEPLIQ